MVGCVTSDRHLYFWENNVTQRLLKKFRAEVLQSGIWYLNEHRVWVTAGADFSITTWDLGGHEREDATRLASFDAHTKKVTDIKELRYP